MHIIEEGKRSTRRRNRLSCRCIGRFRRVTHIRSRRSRRSDRPTSSFLPRLHHILHDHRNPPVRRIHRRGNLTQSLIRESAHLGHLVFPHSVHLHQPSRRVSPIRRKFPVTIVAPLGIRFRIRMPFNRQSVRKFPQFLR